MFLTTDIRKNVKGMDETVQEEWASFVLESRLIPVQFHQPEIFNAKQEDCFRRKFESSEISEKRQFGRSRKTLQKKTKSYQNYKTSWHWNSFSRNRKEGSRFEDFAFFSVNNCLYLFVINFCRDARPVYLSRVKADEIKDGNYF